VIVSNPEATVIVSTKNRKGELRAALDSILSQTANIEALVIDDGSTDGTSEMVMATFPSVRLYRLEPSLGYIVARNRAAELATAPILFSIDDDAVFSTPDVVDQTLREFDHPRIGAIAMPFVNGGQASAVSHQIVDRSKRYLTSSYTGTAHALRRNIFLRLGGYRERLIHQGEEMDYCIRMLAAGYVVRVGAAEPIYHYESSRRDLRRMDYYGRRNDVLFAWHNVPFPHVLVHMLGATIQGALYALKVGRPVHMWLGWLSAYAECFNSLSKRAPVSQNVYRLSRLLKKQKPRLLDEMEPLLAAMQECD
jgi:glycosyltransferase involved in cell wall biosynthesis